MECPKQQANGHNRGQGTNQRHQRAFVVAFDAQNQQDTEYDEGTLIPEADAQAEHETCDEE